MKAKNNSMPKKYSIVYFNPLDEKDIVYFSSDVDVNELCRSNIYDLSSHLTRDKNHALLFDSFDEAKKVLYDIKYYHRMLSKLKTGIQVIDDVPKIGIKENKSITYKKFEITDK